MAKKKKKQKAKKNTKTAGLNRSSTNHSQEKTSSKTRNPDIAEFVAVVLILTGLGLSIYAYTML